MANWLVEQGHRAAFSLELGPDPGDDELLKFAAEEVLVVVTADRGFGRSVFTKRAKSTAIIFLPELSFDARSKLVARVIAEHSDKLERGCWIVARPGKIRIRKP